MTGTRNPPLELLARFSAEYGVSLDWLILGIGEMRRGDSAAAAGVPLFRETAYGSGGKAEVAGVISVPGLAEGAAYAAFVLEKDAMAPALLVGDIIVCRALPSHDSIREGETLAVFEKDGGLTVGRGYRARGADGLEMRFENPALAPRAVGGGQVSEVWALERRITANTEGGELGRDSLSRLEREVEGLKKQLAELKTGQKP